MPAPEWVIERRAESAARVEDRRAQRLAEAEKPPDPAPAAADEQA